MGMKGTLKWPLIIAAIVVVARVVTERTGMPPAVNGSLSAVALHTLIVPLYLAFQIARSGVERPYGTLFKLIGVYVVLTRAMLIPVYWLGRIYEWPEGRFDGLWGPDVSAFVGFIAVPFVTAAIWIVSSLIVGGAIGSLVIAIAGRSAGKQTPTGIPSRP
jgi:hypothetical protein